jgi:hypothetical protein
MFFKDEAVQKNSCMQEMTYKRLRDETDDLRSNQRES